MSIPVLRRTKYRVTNTGVGLASSACGRMVFWRKDGRELVVVSIDGRSVVAADVLPGTDFRTGSLHQLFALPKETTAVNPAADFSQFLVILPLNESTTSSLTLVFDRPGLLGARGLPESVRAERIA